MGGGRWGVKCVWDVSAGIRRRKGRMWVEGWEVLGREVRARLGGAWDASMGDVSGKICIKTTCLLTWEVGAHAPTR